MRLDSSGLCVFECEVRHLYSCFCAWLCFCTFFFHSITAGSAYKRPAYTSAQVRASQVICLKLLTGNTVRTIKDNQD